MMKKLIVLGIVAVMVMGLAATAMADATNWAIFLRGSTDTAGKVGYYGTMQVGTKSTATDPFNLAEGDAYFAGTLNPVGAVFGAGNPGGDVSKDFRAPITNVAKTWNITFTLLNAAPSGYMTIWNQIGATADVPDGIGWTAKLYQANAEFVKGGVLFEMDLTKNGSFSQTGAGYGGTYYQTAAVGNYVLEVGPVPEPGSILALASGLVGLVGFGIRRRK